MKNRVLKLLTLVSAMFLMSCAGQGGSAKWTSEDLTNKKVYKGQTAEQLIETIDKPDRRSVDGNGNQVWEYRKSSESGGGALNTAMRISTFGIASGKNSPYLDILTVYFKGNKVDNFKYEEYVYTWSNSPDMAPRQSNSNTPAPVEAPKSVQEKPLTSPVETKSESRDAIQKTSSSPATMIVTGNKAKIRKKPSTKAEIVKTVQKGAVVQVIKQSDEWYQVELDSGDIGWCQKSVIKRQD